MSQKKLSRNAFKAKIKSAKSAKELKEAQVLFYYTSPGVINNSLIAELTGLSKDKINEITSVLPKKGKASKPLLSTKDMAIFKDICKGKTNREIGDKVGRSFRGIEASRERIMLKLGVKNVAGLITYGLKNNLV